MEGNCKESWLVNPMKANLSVVLGVDGKTIKNASWGHDMTEDTH
jgi:hypothetical protein